jgi:hypothetical protein
MHPGLAMVLGRQLRINCRKIIVDSLFQIRLVGIQKRIKQLIPHPSGHCRLGGI